MQWNLVHPPKHCKTSISFTQQVYSFTVLIKLQKKYILPSESCKIDLKSMYSTLHSSSENPQLIISQAEIILNENLIQVVGYFS